MRGELDFAAALRERVGLLRAWTPACSSASTRARDADAGRRDPGATMRRSGATCALVSGGFTFFTERIAGGWASTSSRPTRSSGGRRIAGTVAEPILGREAKLAALQRLAQDRGLDTSRDAGGRRRRQRSCDDQGRRPRRRLSRQADRHGPGRRVRGRHGDLTALLYLQGSHGPTLPEAATRARNPERARRCTLHTRQRSRNRTKREKAHHAHSSLPCAAPRADARP